MTSKWGLIAVPVAWLVLAGGVVAQQPAAPPTNAPPAAGPPARQRAQPIEIRGQVPTPQVVTVRPRQIPEFNRQVLVPAFYDRQFWEGLLAPYEFGPQLTRTTGVTPGSSASPPLPADSGQRHSAAATGALSDTTAVAPSSSPARPARQGASPTVQGAYSNDPREK